MSCMEKKRPEPAEPVLSSDAPLCPEEEAAWKIMVSRGEEIRRPILAAREAKRAANVEAAKRLAESEGRVYRGRPKSANSTSMSEIPPRTKRWLVARMAGVSFRRAFEETGATWIDVQDAKYRSEEFRCALAAQEENSRELMKAKAMSVVEQSQEEGSRVSMAQTNVSIKILESLDSGNFGRDAVRAAECREEAKAAIGGGFVINLIGDAAKTAEKAPAKRPGRALVYEGV